MPKRKYKSPEHEEFSLDDCDALLKYVSEDFRLQLKQETFLPDLPELGESASLVLTGDDACSTICSTTITQKSEPENKSDDPHAIQTALNMNKTLQQKVVQTINKLHEILAKNQLKQDELLKIINSSVENKVKAKKPVGLFSAPYFRDVRGMYPPDNEDTKQKIKHHDVTSYLPPPKPWHLWEKDKLVNGIGASALSYVLKPFKTKRDFLKSKIKDQNISDEDKKSLKQEIVQIERKIKEECKRPYKDLIKQAEGHIDWMTISASHMEGSRTEEECEMMWENYLSVFVNKGTFTRDEDEKLQALVSKHDGKNWDAVTKELGTNRSAIQCLERYQTKLNKTIMKKNWTPEEDKKLLDLIAMFKVGNVIPWNKVCNFMEGRGRVQVINRYERTVSKEINRSPWSKEEDAMLLACVSRFGQHWQQMQQFFTGRQTYACRERFVNTLDKGLKIGDWTKTEDKQLIHLIQKHGYGKWSKICKEIPGRTDNNCMVRAKRLEIYSLDRYKGRILNDRGEMNLEKLAKILKPVAPSKTCNKQNIRLQNIQNTARETLRTALKNIAPSLEKTIDLDTLNLSTAGMETLRLLHKELQRSEDISNAVPWTPRYVNMPRKLIERKTRAKKKIVIPDSEEEYDSAENHLSCDEPPDEDTKSEDEFSSEEKLWIQKVLESKFQEQSAKALGGVSYSCSLNQKEIIECNLYEAYLSKHLHCAKEGIPEEGSIESSYGGIDLNVTLANAVFHFVQPPILEDETIVLAPNVTTMDALAIMQASELRLRRTADFVNHSISYIRYLTENIGRRPQCVYCYNKSHRCDPSKKQVEYESVVQLMKSNMLVVDEKMNKAAMQESGFSSYCDPNTTCQCSALEKSKASVKLLSKRFMSFFLWPYLFSSIQPSEEQEKLMIKSQPVTYPGLPTLAKKCRKEYGVKKVPKNRTNPNWHNRKRSDVTKLRKQKMANIAKRLQQLQKSVQQTVPTSAVEELKPKNSTENVHLQHLSNDASTEIGSEVTGQVSSTTICNDESPITETPCPSKTCKKNLHPRKCAPTIPESSTLPTSLDSLRRSARQCVLQRKSFA